MFGHIGCSSLDINSSLVGQTVYIDLKLFFISLYRLILKHIVELLMSSFVNIPKSNFCFLNHLIICPCVYVILITLRF